MMQTLYEVVKVEETRNYMIWSELWSIPLIQLQSFCVTTSKCQICIQGNESAESRN